MTASGALLGRTMCDLIEGLPLGKFGPAVRVYPHHVWEHPSAGGLFVYSMVEETDSVATRRELSLYREEIDWHDGRRSWDPRSLPEPRYLQLQFHVVHGGGHYDPVKRLEIVHRRTDGETKKMVYYARPNQAEYFRWSPTMRTFESFKDDDSRVHLVLAIEGRLPEDCLPSLEAAAT